MSTSFVVSWITLVSLSCPLVYILACIRGAVNIFCCGLDNFPLPLYSKGYAIINVMVLVNNNSMLGDTVLDDEGRRVQSIVPCSINIYTT